MILNCFWRVISCFIFNTTKMDKLHYFIEDLTIPLICNSKFKSNTLLHESLQYCDLILKYHDVTTNWCIPFHDKFFSKMILQLDSSILTNVSGYSLKKGNPDLVFFDPNELIVKDWIQLKYKYREQPYNYGWFKKNYDLYKMQCDYIFLHYDNNFFEQEIPKEFNHFFKLQELNIDFLIEKKSELYKYSDFLEILLKKNKQNYFEIISEQYIKKLKLMEEGDHGHRNRKESLL